MRLQQLLTLEGGVHEQGRRLTFTLRTTGPGGVPMQRKVDAVMLPVSEPALKRIGERSKTAAELDPELEYIVLLLQASLRDPGDMSKLLIEDETDLRLLREGLTGLQYPWLGKQYQLMLAGEYPDLVSAELLEEMKQEAEDFSKGPQGEPR